MGVAAAIGDRAEFWARPLEVFVGVSSAFVLITAIATSMAGGERVAYAMARYRMLPHPFARPERGTAPSAAASVAGGVLAVLLLILAGTVGDGVRFLGSLYSFGVLAAFTAAQVAVVVLRAREPGLERPFRVPGNIHVRGVPIPVPAVVGATLTGALWVSALVTTTPRAWPAPCGLRSAPWCTWCRGASLVPACWRPQPAGARSRGRGDAPGGAHPRSPEARRHRGGGHGDGAEAGP